MTRRDAKAIVMRKEALLRIMDSCSDHYVDLVLSGSGPDVIDMFKGMIRRSYETGFRAGVAAAKTVDNEAREMVAKPSAMAALALERYPEPV